MNSSQDNELLKAFIPDNFVEEPSGKEFERKLSKSLRRGSKGIDFIIAIVGFGLGLIFGYIGFYRYLGGGNFFDILYETLKLFVFAFEMEEGKTLLWDLNLARFLCPAATTYSFVLAFAIFFKEKITDFQLKLFSNHIIICGLNKWTAQLAVDFRRTERQIIVITDDEANPYRSKMQNIGVKIIVGSYSDIFNLIKAGVTKAKFLLAFTKDDSMNMEIAINAQKILTHKKSQKTLKCFIHIFDKELYDGFSEHDIFEESQDNFESTLFNIYQNDARILFLVNQFETLLDKDKKVKVKVEQPHLVIMGFEGLGETVFLQATRIGHYPNSKTIKITVMDVNAVQKGEEFLFRYPGIKEIAKLYGKEDIHYSFVNADFSDPQTIEEGLKIINTEDYPITGFVVCLEDENDSIKLSLDVMSIIENREIPIKFHLPFAIYLDENEDLFKLPKNYDVTPFGLLTRNCTREIVTQEDLDKIAKLIHESFCESQRLLGKTSKEIQYLLPWKDLPPHIKDSNRYQADHYLIKLRAIGINLQKSKTTVKDYYQFNEHDIDILAEMEHNRWCAERWIVGWKYSEIKNKDKKESPVLLPYHAIPDEEKNKDKEFIRYMTKILGKLNFVLKKEK